MKKVAILMSTYNGEFFLQDQLDSILSQTYQNIRLVVRDDGSTDSTISILEDYCRKYNNITFYKGKNIKPAKSFLELLREAPEADFYAFCDQDDIWLPEKIESAVSALQKLSSDKPCAYIGSLTFVDKDLKVIGHRKDTIYKMTFSESWIFCVATGCTMLINNKLRELVNGVHSKNVGMHDIWAYRLCLAYGGRAVYDYTPHILYRQHGNNVVGANTDTIKKWKKRLYSIIHHTQGERWLMAKEMFDCCAESMPTPERETLKLIVNYKSSLRDKFRLLFDRDFRTNSKYQNIIFRCSVLLNRY